MFRMKVIVTGARSFLASALVPRLMGDFEVILTSHRGDVTVKGLPIHPLDLSDMKAVDKFIDQHRPAWIVNCAAISLPDWAEDHREETWAANVTAVQNLVAAATKYTVKLLHMSTDYVFSGDHPPYAEEADRSPVNYYGQTKLEGERIIQASAVHWLLCRTTVLYGIRESYHRPNIFEDWFEPLAAGKSVKAASGHYTNPTYVEDCAMALFELIRRDARGIFHTAGPESMSRYEFAKTLAEVLGVDPTLVEAIPVIPKRAVRPHNTTLQVDKLKNMIGVSLRSPREAFPELIAKKQLF
jgi:dTDP-4-dehydrorhamnose reductase